MAPTRPDHNPEGQMKEIILVEAQEQGKEGIGTKRSNDKQMTSGTTSDLKAQTDSGFPTEPGYGVNHCPQDLPGLSSPHDTLTLDVRRKNQLCGCPLEPETP
ncbi:unnamed protein product [Ilex paraguariensis]|uniref:Uncharacterized protein n=1 Tax=Ilex paraguariensis TaxID=185542 RepID=A0ABC8RT71_9AQUA